jgi:ComF family protein
MSRMDAARLLDWPRAAAGLRALARHGVDLLLPPRCPACREIVENNGRFCLVCWRGLTFITDPVCAGCGAPFDIDRGPGARCGACLATPPRFAAARAALAYAGTARTVLLGFKHGDRQHLVDIMAPQLVRAGRDWFGVDTVLVPVPLHPARLWRRGFNQAALLAHVVARRTGSSLAVDALVRVKPTPSSQGMGRRARADKVRGAFRVARPEAIKGKAIIIIDDVFTTGATAEACARMLLRSGAREVRVLTWARVVRDA